ncbi:MAG: hypothetical protein IJM54_01220, partial [Thermoguttaceae bacterium]|nr:hypothetical protein [Thermoguttaceae bacterium]
FIFKKVRKIKKTGKTAAIGIIGAFVIIIATAVPLKRSKTVERGLSRRWIFTQKNSDVFYTNNPRSRRGSFIH